MTAPTVEPYDCLMSFEPGDLVLCVDDSGQEDMQIPVVAGHVYTVLEVMVCGCSTTRLALFECRPEHIDCYCPNCDLDLLFPGWYASRFRKLAPRKRIVEQERQFESVTPVGSRSSFGVS